MVLHFGTYYVNLPCMVSEHSNKGLPIETWHQVINQRIRHLY
uniref:Uncharacterized protein n=1 Tax=Arundo donax TaxID=35708 RepID=A0A0A9R991_ARUDO